MVAHSRLISWAVLYSLYPSPPYHVCYFPLSSLLIVAAISAGTLKGSTDVLQAEDVLESWGKSMYILQRPVTISGRQRHPGG